uniref:Gaduscidin-2 n=1 Tax=Gadus morhua TaxID=8049 RepID=E2EZU3_GADMO|nr:gaduscidin-2 [Gadus morhua]ADU34222.1 piscidin-2 precursor [Gadus morhua]
MRCIFLLFVVLLLAMMVLPAEGFLHHIVGLIHHGLSLFGDRADKAEEYIAVD